MKKTVHWKKLLPAAGVLLLVACLAALPFLLGSGQTQQSAAQIQSGTVETASVVSTLSGAGTLTAQEGVAIALPSGVELTEYAVENGELVAAGDLLAAADRASVMETIATVQENLEYIDTQLRSSLGESADSVLYAAVAGRVKDVYAASGDSVAAVMTEHGALLTVSLDGLMALRLETEAALTVGETVTVTLSDGTELPGLVESAAGGLAVVTLEDGGFAVGDTARVQSGSGEALGTGALYVHSELRVTGFTGTVSRLHVSAGQQVYKGSTLLTLTDTELSAGYQLLAAQRREYEDVMLELFVLYQNEGVCAPAAGVVSGVDESVTKLSALGGLRATPLLNAPDGDDSLTYTDYYGIVTAVGYGELKMRMCPAAVTVADYAALGGLDTSDEALTQETGLSPDSTVPVYAYSAESGWQQSSLSAVAENDVLLFSYADDGTLVWIIRAGHVQKETPATGGGGSGSATELFEMYLLTHTTVMTVTPQETMTLTITVDELDILSLSPGQEAAVTLDALPGQFFTGTVTKLDTAGSNSGGSSKYAAVITLSRAPLMLPGMNASAVITLGSLTDVPTVPLAALYETGTETLVYTAVDKKTGEPCDPVRVTTGASDGERVELLSGLELGDHFYYTWYDAVSYPHTSESPQHLLNRGIGAVLPTNGSSGYHFH